jgi:ABC-type bacteriocin/lantibiotic exporter with double-glycine peptidase domain
MLNFFRLLGEKRRDYAFLTLCMAMVAGAEAALHPILMKSIFDAVSTHKAYEDFIVLGLYYLLLGIFANIFNYLLSLWQIKIDNSIIANVSNSMLNSYYNKSFKNVLKNGDGYYVARIRSDVNDGLAPILGTVRGLIISIFTFIILISVLMYVSLQAFIILSIIIPISTTVTIIVGKRIRHLTNIERDNEAAVVDILTKSVAAFKMVNIFILRSTGLKTFSSTLENALESKFRKQRVVYGLQTVGDLTMVVSDVCSIIVGGFLVLRNQLTLGSFIAFMNAFWRATTTLIDIFNTWAQLHGYVAIVDRIVSFIEPEPRAFEFQTGSSVEARSIGFSYGTTQVVKDFDLLIQPGQKVLILGSNGSGKTTLANILSGLLPHESGTLMLPRTVSAMTLPIRFPPTLVKELPADIALLANLGVGSEDVLNSLPYDLSAGQQQKIAIALALSKQADLYILDEPLANIDTASSDVAMSEIMIRTNGRILIIIMHNAENYKSYFDQICVIQRVGENECNDGSCEGVKV